MRPSSDLRATDLFASGGEMGSRIRTFDWSRHPLGGFEQWPRSLRTVLGMVLASRTPMWLGWEEELYFFCNDACLATFGLKHEEVTGAPAREVWSQIWIDIGPCVESVVASGAATSDEARVYVLERNGRLEETNHTFSCSPLTGDDGRVQGTLCIVTEDTERVLAGRRMATLRELAADLSVITSRQDVFKAVRTRLAERPRDLAFALIYLFDADNREARLACAHGVDPGDAFAPVVIPWADSDLVWPVTALAEGRSVVTDDLEARFTVVPSRPLNHVPTRAVLVSLPGRASGRPAGFLVAGLNPLRPLDPEFRCFIDLLASQIAEGLSQACSTTQSSPSLCADLAREGTQAAEFAEETAQQRLDRIFSGVNEFVGMFDRAWRCVHVDERIAAFVGKRGADLRGRVVWDVFPQLLGTELEAVMRLAGETEESQHLEYFHAPAQRGFDCHVHPSADGFTLFGTDITARREAELALRESERRYRDLVQKVPAALYTCDASGRITMFNAAAADLWGRSPEIGVDLWCGSVRIYYLDGTQMPLDQCPMAVALREGRAVRDAEILIERPDGTRRHVLPYPQPLRDEKGGLAGAVNMLVDVTDRKRVESLAQEREARIAHLVALMPAAVYSCDANGRIDFFNRRAVELWGREPELGDEDCVFCGSFRLWRPDGTRLLHEQTPMAYAVREGLSFRDEEVIIERPSGSRVTVSVNIDPLLDGEGRRNGAINVFVDITERRRAEVSWRESEERLRLATQTGKIGLWEWDIIQDRVTWTDSLYAIHGVDPATFDATGEGFAALVHPEDRVVVQEAIRRSLEEGTPYEFEFRVIRADDGATVWMFTNAVVLRDNGKATRMLGASVDITDRKRAAEALRESEQRFSRFMRHLPGLAWIKDEQGRYVFANDSALRVFGESLESLPGRTDSDIFPPDIAEQFQRNDRVALASEGGTQTCETLPHHDDGRLHHSLVSKFPIPATDGRPMLVGGMAIDITEQRDAEIRIQQLAAIVESSEDAILSETLDAVITSWNCGAVHLFGYTAEEIVGQTILRLIPEDRQGEEAVILARLGRGESIDHYETVRLHKDGTNIDVSLSISPITGADGTTIGASKIARDITGRKRTEAELRRSEQLYRAVGESIDYGVWVCDATGRNTYISESFLKLVGLTLQECGDFGWGRVLHPDDAEAAIAAWQECVREGSIWEREHRIRGVDGTWHPILARGVPVRDDSGAIVSWVGINLDISRLKRNEEALRQQTRNLEILNRVGRMLAAERELEPLVQAVTDAGREVSGASFGAFFYNVEDESGDSYRLYSLSGAKREKFAGFGMPRNTPLFGPTFHGEGPVRVGDVLRDPRYGTMSPHHGMPSGHPSVRSYLAVPVVSRSGDVHGGLVYGHPEADVFTAEAEDLVVAIAAQAAIAIDNSNLYRDMQRELEKHERSERALRESEERFRTLADNIAAFAWTADPNGRVFWFNRRWFEFTGTTPAEMEGWGWRKVHHPDHVARVMEKYARCIANGDIWEDTFPLRRHDGAYRWFLSRAVPIRDAGGSVLRWFGTNTDITERRDVEFALERARDEAVAASRAKDDFLAALSHELRTPLNPVLLLASDAADNPGLPEPVRADFETIRKNVSLEARLIDDLLDLTRISRGKLRLDIEEHDVQAILRDALATIRPHAAEKELKIELDLKAESVRVRADAVRLQQVFWNVLKNAVKFTAQGGRIGIAMRKPSSNGRIEIFVTDTGIGLTESEIVRIFEAFSQGDHANGGDSHRFGGLGLGLAISRMVVEMHDGTIRATSGGPGQGATFIIDLPILTGPGPDTAPAAPERGAAAPKSDAGRGRRVLLVEDHAPTRVALERLLVRRKFVVTAAGTLAEARAAAAADSFDLLISDVGLPDGSGHDLMRECACDTGLRGIALTGYGMEQDLARSRAAGFSAHLTKPVSVHALDRAIAEALETQA